MDYDAGIDMSFELSSICVVDATGQIVREAKVASAPEAFVGFLTRLGLPLTRIGWRRVLYRSGCMRAWPRPGRRSCFWRPGT